MVILVLAPFVHVTPWCLIWITFELLIKKKKEAKIEQ